MRQHPESQPVCQASPEKPRLLDQVRASIRTKHYSLRTEKTYVHWIKRYIYFTGKRHPRELGAAEVSAFLSHLATERNVAAATQNQTLSALLFLYGQVLDLDLPWLDGMVRAKRPVRLPHALSRKYPRAGFDWGWQFVFPSSKHSADPETSVIRRHHVYADTPHRSVKCSGADSCKALTPMREN